MERGEGEHLLHILKSTLNVEDNVAWVKAVEALVTTGAIAELDSNALSIYGNLRAGLQITASGIDADKIFAETST